MGQTRNLLSLLTLLLLGGLVHLDTCWADNPGVLDQGELKLVPTRDVSFIAAREGFYPEKITIFEGEKIRFFITSITDHPNCFMLKEKNIFLSANNGKISEAEAFFEKPGIFLVKCPSTGIQGQVVVLPKKKKVERKVAQIGAKRKVWRPKDVPDDWSEEEGQ